MSSMLNIGASGLMAQTSQLTTIGNNIANSSTAGYKASHVSFADSFYNVSGREANGALNQSGQGVRVAGTLADWSTGASQETAISTNLSIMGDGFLPVEYGGETLFTRNGSFAWTDYSLLSGGAQTGYALALPNGAALQDVNQDLILFDAIPTSMDISSDGTMTVADATITQGSGVLGLQLFGNPDALMHLEGGLFQQSAEAIPSSSLVTPGTNGSGGLRQGQLELSNVDLVTEFTGMIAAQRAFQANSRTITTADELLQEIMGLKR
jgi:flagellar basal body rod protein FlgG